MATPRYKDLRSDGEKTGRFEVEDRVGHDAVIYDSKAHQDK